MKILASSQEITTRITEIATALIRDHADTKPLFVSLLRGAAPFTSLLLFEITRQAPDFHPELDYMMVRTYGDQKTASTPQIVTDLAPSTSIQGRTVIVLDDVLDKGITADFIFSHLHNLGAASTHLAVLCQKDTVRERNITAAYAAFTVGDEWLIGMGMDDAETGVEAYRWLHEIRAKV